jgi:putative Holliday junction resolvase
VTRLLGIDHGRRRIGIALADDETGMAFARPALQARGTDIVMAVVGLARREGVDRVVVGLPRNMDGSEGPQAAQARAFGDRLAASGLVVSFMDERLTSWAAREQLGSAGRRPDRASGELDSAAARLILQDYLDAQGTPDRQGGPPTDAPDHQEIG